MFSSSSTHFPPRGGYRHERGDCDHHHPVSHPIPILPRCQKCQILHLSCFFSFLSFPPNSTKMPEMSDSSSFLFLFLSFFPSQFYQDARNVRFFIFLVSFPFFLSLPILPRCQKCQILHLSCFFSFLSFPPNSTKMPEMSDSSSFLFLFLSFFPSQFYQDARNVRFFIFLVSFPFFLSLPILPRCQKCQILHLSCFFSFLSFHPNSTKMPEMSDSSSFLFLFLSFFPFQFYQDARNVRFFIFLVSFPFFLSIPILPRCQKCQILHLSCFFSFLSFPPNSTKMPEMSDSSSFLFLFLSFFPSQFYQDARNVRFFIFLVSFPFFLSIPILPRCQKCQILHLSCFFSFLSFPPNSTKMPEMSDSSSFLFLFLSFFPSQFYQDARNVRFFIFLVSFPFFLLLLFVVVVVCCCCCYFGLVFFFSFFFFFFFFSLEWAIKASHALPTAKVSASLVSDFSVHSTPPHHHHHHHSSPSPNSLQPGNGV